MQNIIERSELLTDRLEDRLRLSDRCDLAVSDQEYERDLET